MFDRREFLKRAALAVAGLGIDPELLIWRPRQMVVVPAMPNVLPCVVPAGFTINQATLAEWALQMDPNGKVDAIVRMLSAQNDILADLPMRGVDLAEGESFSVRVPLERLRGLL